MKRCLVVDASRVIRRVATKIVTDLGFETAEAETGIQAVTSCGVRMPEIVLLDWDLPEMSGLDVTKVVREMPNGKHPTIVFCTIRNDVADIRQALAGGADDYIMKPFDSEIVAAKFLLLGLLE